MSSNSGESRKRLPNDVAYYGWAEQEAFNEFTAIAAILGQRRRITRVCPARKAYRSAFRPLGLDHDPQGFVGAWTLHLSEEVSIPHAVNGSTVSHRLVVVDHSDIEIVGSPLAIHDYRRPALRHQQEDDQPRLIAAQPLESYQGQDMSDPLRIQAEYMAWLDLARRALPDQSDAFL